jgi:hypothetical protein
VKRSLFSMGFAHKAAPWMGEPAAGIPTYDMTREEVESDKGHILKRLPVPPGHTLSYPYMVKVTGEGEYWVKSDGTTEFYSYKFGRWEPAEPVDKNDLWYQMTHIVT